MPSQHDKPKRWRPRFSLRTLAIVVTLVCAYLACWKPTAIDGIEDVQLHLLRVPSGFGHASSPLPLVVAIDVWELGFDDTGYVISTGSPNCVYYVWFFGVAARVPGRYPPARWRPPITRLSRYPLNFRTLPDEENVKQDPTR